MCHDNSMCKPYSVSSTGSVHLLIHWRKWKFLRTGKSHEVECKDIWVNGCFGI